jgi:hypothetical protein
MRLSTCFTWNSVGNSDCEAARNDETPCPRGGSRRSTWNTGDNRGEFSLLGLRLLYFVNRQRVITVIATVVVPSLIGVGALAASIFAIAIMGRGSGRS